MSTTTTTTKPTKLLSVRSVSRDKTNGLEKNELLDLSSNHSFVAPNEICRNAVGLFTHLSNQSIIDIPFSRLYEMSLIIGWKQIFRQEQQKLKANDHSVLKCLVLNRWLHEYTQNPENFTQRTKDFYEEISQRMRCEFPPGWTCDDLYDEIRRWQDMQCRRRMFYFSYEESRSQASFLMLHKAASNWCHCLINHCRKNRSYWKSEGEASLITHFQHSFIIVAQPTGSEGTAVTQYTKTSSGHSARLHCRIICLLDPVLLQDYVTLSDIEVTLCPLDREMNDRIERQPRLTWQTKTIRSSEGIPVVISYAEICTVQLEQFDSTYKRLLLNSTLCQLEFRLKISMKNPAFEGYITLTSQPFGICSHGQYFPKFLAKIFIYEMNQILKHSRRTFEPALLIEFVRRYHIRMAGVVPTELTNRYLQQMFEQIYTAEMKTNKIILTIENLYEDILSKIIHQIGVYALYPVLSLMYNDGLFLGICDSHDLDRRLRGTTDRPDLLLRLNSLANDQCSNHTTLQLAVHDGTLKRAHFDMKTFANEICRFICESVSDQIKASTLFSAIPPRLFSDFQWYFDTELYRLNKMVPPSGDVYDPLLPIIWMTMRNHEITSSGLKRKRLDSGDTSISSSRDSADSSIVVRHVDQSPRQFIIELPEHITTSVEQLRRLLEEKIFEQERSKRSISPCSTMNSNGGIPSQIEIKQEIHD